MKFLAGFLTLLLFTTILQAQMPYAGSNLQPYYPGATAPPYYPQAYYPQPAYVQIPAYVQQPVYVQGPYVPPQLSVADNSAEVDNLSRQVEQLSDQLRQLEAQLTLTPGATGRARGRSAHIRGAGQSRYVGFQGRQGHSRARLRCRPANVVDSWPVWQQRARCALAT